MTSQRPTEPYSLTPSGHARAPKGDVSLAEYTHIRAWLAGVEALPGFVPMVATRVGLAR